MKALLLLGLVYVLYVRAQQESAAQPDGTPAASAQPPGLPPSTAAPSPVASAYESRGGWDVGEGDRLPVAIFPPSRSPWWQRDTFDPDATGGLLTR